MTVPEPPTGASPQGFEPVVVTAAYGDDFRWAARGMVASLRDSNPGVEVVAFSDQALPGVSTIQQDFDQVLLNFPEYYHRRRRSNIAKFWMVREIVKQRGASDVIWIDADTLVFARLDALFVPGALNLLVHGSRREDTIDCGNGLLVPGSEYAIGSVWGLPSTEHVYDCIDRLVVERTSWADADRLESGDQIMINHLRVRLATAEPDAQVNWINERTDDVLNYQIVNRKRGHPVVGRSHYRSLRLRDGQIWVGERRVGIWAWTSPTLFAHRQTDFRSLGWRVRRRLRQLYA